VAIYALTKQGASQARKLAKALPASRLFLPRRLAGPHEEAFDKFTQALGERFQSFKGHVAFCATGIAVRAIAPLINKKTDDPAVVVCDHHGHWAISLLSGHLGGANQLAREVARILGGETVITTGTDTEGLPSLEMAAKDLGLTIANLPALSHVSMALLEGERVRVYDPWGWLQPVLKQRPELFELLDQEPGPAEDDHPLVWVGWQTLSPGRKCLVLRPPCLALGVGCNRGTPADEIVQLIHQVLDKQGLEPKSIMCLASVQLKADENGLIQAARELGTKTIFFEPEQLAKVDVPNPSTVVQRHLGTSSVCEAAALLAARGGPMLIDKQKSPNVTVAVALAPASYGS
jgi:cobalt-precorrin 5A hydrolase